MASVEPFNRVQTQRIIRKLLGNHQMGNCISGPAQQALIQNASAHNQTQNQGSAPARGRATGQAAASLAASIAASVASSTTPETAFQVAIEINPVTLDLILATMPETVTPFLKAFKNEAFEHHELVELYKVLETGDFSKLPTPEALTHDLRNLCDTNLESGKQFIHEALESVADFVPKLFTEPVVPHASVVALAESGHVLLKALGPMSDEQVSTVGHLKLDSLIALHSLFNLAVSTGEPAAHLIKARNIVASKQEVLLQEFHVPNLEDLLPIALEAPDVQGQFANALGAVRHINPEQ